MNMLKMCATPEQRYNYEMFKIIKIRFILLLTLGNIVIICIFKKEVLLNMGNPYIYIFIRTRSTHFNINFHTIIQSIKTKDARRSFSAYNI